MTISNPEINSVTGRREKEPYLPHKIVAYR
jgi:hypothetical protein